MFLSRLFSRVKSLLLAYDLFTESSDTELSLHTANAGGQWTNIRSLVSGGVGNLTCKGSSANYVECIYTGGNAGTSCTQSYVLPDCGYSDVEITVDITTASSTSSGNSGAILARSNGQNYAAAGGSVVRAHLHDSFDAIYITEFTNGSGTIRGSTAVTLSASTTYACKLTIKGANVTFTVGGTTVTGTLSSPTTNNRHGIEGNNFAGATGTRHANFYMRTI